MKKNNIRVKGLVLLLAIVLFSFPISYIFPIDTSKDSNKVGDIHPSAEVTNTTQWIKNPNFDSSVNWTSIKGALGDPTDVNAYIEGGMANYEILGKKQTFSLVETPIIGSNWVAVPNPDFPHGPTSNFTDSEGLKVYHLFDDHDANQNPSVHWDRNFTMPVNMSDYIITSASIQAIVNATVSLDVDCPGDTEATNSGYNLNQRESYDYVRFYVLVSDLSKDKVYEVAYIQPTDLGAGNPWPTPGTDTLDDTYLISVPDSVLIFYLTSVLSTNYLNFTVTLGIRIYTADNSDNYDNDQFNEILIKSVNLTFTYERRIDQQTSISWNQYGDKPSDITSNPIVVNEAILNFKYKVNDTWPSSSPNSEIRILINNIQHSETIKLSTANTSFQDAKSGGFDITYLIDKDKNINVSIQVSLADNFELDRIITFSIDDVYLNISYTETVADIQTKYELFLNDINKTDDLFIEQPLGVNLNITIKYTTEMRVHIPGATVQIEGKVNDILDEDLFQQYYIIVDTTQLGIGTSSLKIKAQKNLYESQEFSFLVKVTERDTELELFLNNNPKSESETISVEEGSTINATVYYKDLLTSNPLNNATVTLLGVGDLDEMNNYYYIIINSSDLILGINAFTIFAQLINYTPQSIHFFIEVYEKGTQYQLFLNDVDSTSNPSISLGIFESLNITVKYMDNESQHITNATLQLIGEGLMLNLTENEVLQQYSRTIDTVQLGLGVKLLNVIAQKSKHETQNIQIFVEITSRDTEIELFLDGNHTNDGAKINVEIDDIINVTVFFRDVKNGTHIPNATVELLGWGMLNETNNQYYNFTIQATDLDQGITIFTVFADKTFYEPQTIRFFIETVERETDLLLYLNDAPKNDGEMIKVEVDDTINITVYFRDGEYGTHIQDATVQLVGWDNLTETNNQYYNITINANDLEQGITILTIFTEKENYQPQTIRFFIEVTARSSQLQLFLDGNPETDDPVIYELPIKEFLNITVKYMDNKSQHITNATVQLKGEYLTFNLTEQAGLGQYYILGGLDTTILGIGSKTFTIIAYAPNYIPKIIGLYISINKIVGTISRADGGAQIEVDVGEDVLLRIVLKDTLNNTIKNANVTFTWAYGQGELEDLDNDGIYTITLPNVREGVHEIKINAIFGDDYTFQEYKITLIVSTPTPSVGPNLSWLIPLLVYGFSGVILVVGTIFTLYIKRWRFPPLVRKIRKLRNNVRKGKKTKAILLNSREELISRNFQEQMKILDLEILQPKMVDKIEKI